MLQIIFILLGFLVISPGPVYAHAFGQQYNLPVPFWLYAYGAAFAVIISFAIIGFFINDTKKNISYPKIDISNWKVVFLLKNHLFQNLVKIVSLFLFIITILSGLFGTADSVSNFSTTFFWIIFLLGLTYCCAIIGNVYSFLNPWKTISEFLGKEEGIMQYPKRFGYYPGLIIYFFLIWIELIGRFNPLQLSTVIVLYSTLTFLGIYIFGSNIWFEYFDFFSIFFRIISKISIVEKKEKRFFLRPPFVGLLLEKIQSFSLLFFIVFMLSSTAFDGFRETTSWWNIYFAVLSPAPNFLGDFAHQILNTIGLILSLVLFMSIYFILIFLMKMITRSHQSFKQLCFSFAFSLVPIALVYNVAHYYTLLVIQGQSIIHLISDPLGLGWDLFGTSNTPINIGIISTNTIWHSQVAFILIGHIAAVYLAHIIALGIFPTYKKAIVSQLPMLVLMVSYTVIGLWILSQPLTSGL